MMRFRAMLPAGTSPRPCARYRSGQAFIELALTIALLAVILMGIIEIGLLLYVHVQVSNSAREAARAASLYRATRFREVSLNNPSKPTTCDSVNGSALAGWSLQQTIDQAVVYRELDANGCPPEKNDTRKQVIYTSLGRLEHDPQRWTAAVTPEQESFCRSDPGECRPTAGTSGRLVLSYTYEPAILSGLIPGLARSIEIRKPVIFEYHQ